ncbi:TPA: cell surface protein, partial [Streptococcus pneumoniae]
SLQNKVADLEKEISNLEILLGGADSEDDTAALQNKLATKKAELEKTQKELDAALNELGPDGDEEETPAPAPQPEQPAPAPKPEQPAPAPKPEQPAPAPKPEQPAKPEKPAEEPTQPEKPATPKTGWKQENGMWYFYNTDGSMATGWLQ